MNKFPYFEGTCFDDIRRCQINLEILLLNFPDAMKNAYSVQPFTNSYILYYRTMMAGYYSCSVKKQNDHTNYLGVGIVIIKPNDILIIEEI